MPQRYFYLDDEKQQCLTASWKHNWRHFTLRLQDQEVSSFTMKEELAEGQVYVMPDGRLLSVRLNRRKEPDLVLSLDGMPMHGSDTDLRRQVKNNYQLAFFLGILNIMGGLLAESVQSELLLHLGFGYETAIVGVAYLSLSRGIKRLSLFAVYAMIALLAFDIAFLCILSVLENGTGSSPASGLLLNLVFIYAFVKGAGAIKKLKTKVAATITA
ncbi:hypothetical protein [Pontibacter diazotrophicus]|nr:hypothetical protein [Pontibacter diazotrophicus]